MTDSKLFNYFSHVTLPAPTLPTEEAAALLRDEFELEGDLVALGSQQDQNFMIRPGADSLPSGVLKISNPVFSESEIELQTLAATYVAQRQPSIRVPHVLDGPTGPLSGWWQTSEGALHARVMAYMPGRSLTGSQYLSPRVMARLGDLAARVSLALSDLTHPASARTLQWDLQHAERVIDTLLPLEHDAQIRSRVATAAEPARQLLTPLIDRLPRQIGHYDITDDNVMASENPVVTPDCVLDFGDTTESWRVGELVVGVSAMLHHAGATPLSTMAAVAAFHELQPLTADEADALWPLVLLRACVLVLSGRHQVTIDENNAYASAALDHEFKILEQAISVPLPVMTNLVREVVGLPPSFQRPTWTKSPILNLDGRHVTIDAGTTAPLNDEGAWMHTTTLDAHAYQAIDDGAAGVILRAGKPILTGAPDRTPALPATVPTAASLWLAHDAPISFPTDTAVFTTENTLTLVANDATLTLTCLSADFLTRPTVLPARSRILVALSNTAAAEYLPAAVPAAYANAWSSVFGDPSAALNIHQDGSPPQSQGSSLITRRRNVLAEVQEHYYEDPPQIERGWREYLMDTDGRVYLDMVNNVASVGHAHPKIAAVASRQLRLLNTNSRFNYSVITTYAERIASTLPEELDTVFLVNSGSEATDLALRIAMAYTGRTHIVAMRESYHGWTFASDAVSTSIADNPNALTTRPPWVHTVDAANDYRGVYRGSEASRYAPKAVADIRSLAESGVSVAGFICESYFGNAGGVALPDGYLRQVYAAVRAVGGITIADEVQVGFGRLGEWFWGFQHQNVIPDIVAVAKSIGSGQPVGAVITRRAIADRYRTQGYFFSSTGGSPLSSVIGTAVLDIIQEEDLQGNAKRTGNHLISRLRGLAARHPIIGRVHGSGLYIGVEFVRDHLTLEPATEETAAICDRLLELGVIMQPTGDHQNVLKVKPPLCVSRASVDYFVDQLDETLTTGW